MQRFPGDPLAVLDAVARVGPRHLGHGVLDGVQRHVDAAVALGVDGHLIALAVSFQHKLLLALGRELEHAPGVLGGIVGIAADIGVVEGAGVYLDGAVAAGLDRAQPEPVAAEAGAEPQVPLQVEALVGQIVDHQVDPHLEPALVNGLLVRPVVVRRVTGAGVVRRGDAHGVVLAARQLHAVLELLEGGVRHQTGYRPAGGLLPQHPGQLAGTRVPVHVAALGLGRVVVDTGELQGHAIDHPHVGRAVGDDQRVVGRRGVELGPGGPALLRDGGVLVALGLDPLPLGRRGGALADPRQHVLDGVVGRGPHVHHPKADAERHEVGVGLDEPGQHRLAAGVDDPRGPAGALPHLVVAAHVQDPVSLQGHGLGRGTGVVHRDHGAVDQDRVRVETLRQRHPYPSFLPRP